MTRQILIPAPAHRRVAAALDGLDHELDVLSWAADGVTRAGVDGAGVPVEEGAARPEAAWLAPDVLFSGELAAMAKAIVDLGSVQWVQGPLAGVDAPPFGWIRDAGIRLSNSDAPNEGVAEYVLSSLLAVVHDYRARLDAHCERRWAQVPWTEISSMTWAVIGFGSIGRAVARRARPFGVEVIGVRRTAVADDAADRMATLDQLPDVLGRADAVILACPLTDETRHLANADFFAAMKPGSILVNVARGGVVDDEALLAALDRGTPGTAILDVFDTEPLPAEDPLWSHPSIVLTSHVAGAGSGLRPRSDRLFVEQLDNYLAGRPLRLELS
ncbi:MAG: D-2-hydroxyacid dehydrogenase [Actinomycetota bacterium]